MKYNIFIEHLLGSEVSSSSKLMMMVLINHRNKSTGLCYPSYSTLACECSLSVKSIQRSKNELEEAGFVQVISKKVSKSGYKCNHYIIDIDLVVTESTIMSMDSTIDTTMDSTIVTESYKPSKPKEPYESKRSIKNNNNVFPFSGEPFRGAVINLDGESFDIWFQRFSYGNEVKFREIIRDRDNWYSTKPYASHKNWMIDTPKWLMKTMKVAK